MGFGMACDGRDCFVACYVCMYGGFRILLFSFRRYPILLGWVLLHGGGHSQQKFIPQALYCV